MPARVSKKLRLKVAHAAGDRCGYCLVSQRFLPVTLELDHLIPVARGGPTDEENLWLACSACNQHKADQVSAVDPVTNTLVALFDPRRQSWAEHFVWSADGSTISGLTPCGRATVQALQLNREVAVIARRNWVAAGWHPPQVIT